eukprot:4594526-Amphidinium_carterae.1
MMTMSASYCTDIVSDYRSSTVALASMHRALDSLSRPCATYSTNGPCLERRPLDVAFVLGLVVVRIQV